MNTRINNIIEYVKTIMSENEDLYFPVFDDPFFILNTEDKEKRMIARALAILFSYEKDQSGQILMIGNQNASEIEEGFPSM